MLDTKVGTKGFGRLVFLDIEFIVSDNDMENQVKIEGFFLIRDGRLFFYPLSLLLLLCVLHPDVVCVYTRMLDCLTSGCG